MKNIISLFVNNVCWAGPA